MNHGTFLASLLKKKRASRRKSDRQRQRFLGRKTLRMEPLEERAMLALKQANDAMRNSCSRGAQHQRKPVVSRLLDQVVCGSYV